MKLDIESPPPVKVERKFILTLTEKEASAMKSLMLAIHNNVSKPGPISQLVFELYHVFDGSTATEYEVFEEDYSPHIRAYK